MSAQEVRELLPGAEVLPPAAVGDVLRAAWRRDVARIAIIDGYFERMAAVWHKEVLVALEQGIEVWGAASMGALRAAELAPYGMRGVGAIYRDYVRGVLVADDEVAVAHAPAEYGYRAMSDALVNIRYGLAQAVHEGVIDEPARAVLVALAQARFYRDRSWEQLALDARALDARALDARALDARALDARALDARALDALSAWPKPDRKADDARVLLRRLRRARAGSGRRAAAPKIRVPRTWALRQLESLLR